MIQGCDYKIIYQNLPESIKGFALKSDGFYTIVINPKHGIDVQQQTIQHELRHIVSNDFDRQDVNFIELNS